MDQKGQMHGRQPGAERTSILVCLFFGHAEEDQVASCIASHLKGIAGREAAMEHKEVGRLLGEE